MTVFDEAIVAGPAAAEGICVSCPFREAGPRVLGLEYARERARAEAAEARCEELRRAEVEARSVAGSLKWRLDKCRGELKAAGDEVKSVRRMAKNALALQAEVSRLEKLLSQAGVESGKRSTIMSLREENARLKKDVRAAKDRVGRIKLLERETGDLRFWLRGSHERLERIVVDNPRFLILPWIEIPNLGSHILSLVRRRLPEDWTARYNTAPVLIETFVETPRYTGAVYKASGWIPVGTTQGRGRYDRDKLHGKPRKDIWLRPLRKNWKQTLNR